jgi:hypothetical protein
MPTIKRTAEGKIITKSGKVSCSCCAIAIDDCCMYDSSQFQTDPSDEDADLFDTDLPEKIKVNGVELTHTGFGDYTCDADQPRLSYTPSTNVWVVSISDDYGGIQFRTCMIGEIGGFAVEDEFEACYKIYLQAPDTPYPGSLYATVYRESLCKWTNYADYIDPFGSSPYLVELIFDPSIQRWYADLGGAPFYFEKSPHQDTPVGAYPAQNLMPGEPVYTVNVEPC